MDALLLLGLIRAAALAVLCAVVGLGGNDHDVFVGLEPRTVISLLAIPGPPLPRSGAELAAEAERAEPVATALLEVQHSTADRLGSVRGVWPPADIAAAIRAVLRGRGWEEWRIDDAICVNDREDRTGVAVRHEEDGTHSYGSYQLNTEGRLPDFYARGYDDPFSVEQQANWLADVAGEWDGGWWGFWQPWLSAREACL